MSNKDLQIVLSFIEKEYEEINHLGLKTAHKTNEINISNVLQLQQIQITFLLIIYFVFESNFQIADY